MPDKRVFILSTGQDTGGWAWRLFDSGSRVRTGWRVRATAASSTYIGYPIDLPHRRPLVEHLYDTADVVHLRNGIEGWRRYDNGQGKPLVVQHHGTAFRSRHAELWNEIRAIGAVQICSTIDLSLLEREVEWVPAPYNLADLQALRARHYRPHDGVIRVAHAPTARSIKGTGHFLAAMANLATRHAVEVEVIENARWDVCLRRKANADIFYDQMELGYGNNAIEAWGMGLPVVAGVARHDVRAVMKERWGGYPFAFAQPHTLERVLERLIVSEEARREYSERGAEHFARYHDERVAVPLMVQVWESARPVAPGPVRKGSVHGRTAERLAQRLMAGGAAATW